MKAGSNQGFAFLFVKRTSVRTETGLASRADGYLRTAGNSGRQTCQRASLPQRSS